jgi:hypothetical protein
LQLLSLSLPQLASLPPLPMRGAQCLPLFDRIFISKKMMNCNCCALLFLHAGTRGSSTLPCS